MDKIKIIILSLIFILMCGCGYKEYLRDDLGDDVKKSATKTGCTYTFQDIPDDLKINCGDGKMSPVINFSDDGDSFYCEIVMDMNGTLSEDRNMYSSWIQNNQGFEVKINGKKMNEIKSDSGKDFMNSEYISYICSINNNGKVYDGTDASIIIRSPQSDTYKKGNDNIRRIDTYKFNVKNIKTNKNDIYIESLKSRLNDN